MIVIYNHGRFFVVLVFLPLKFGELFFKSKNGVHFIMTEWTPFTNIQLDFC